MKLQRDQENGSLIKFGAAQSAYDSEYYGDRTDSDKYLKFIPQEDVDNDGLVDPAEGSWRAAAGAMNNPEFFKNELALQGKDVDPFRETRSKTLKDKEDSYRSQWRTRPISPPRADPFADDAPSTARTYKDIIHEVKVNKEHAVCHLFRFPQ